MQVFPGFVSRINGELHLHTQGETGSIAKGKSRPLLVLTDRGGIEGLLFIKRHDDRDKGGQTLLNFLAGQSHFQENGGSFRNINA